MITEREDNVELGVVLFVVRDAVNHMESKGLLKTDGKFGTFTPQLDAELVSIIENSLKSHGVVVPAQVDKVLMILPLVLQLAGVK
jgi:DNA-binding FadR family transcriptional regulator